MELFKAYAPITKVDDEQRMVYGYASTDMKDSQGDIVAIDAIEKALPDYMRFANIREMHTMSAVGVAKSAEVDDKGLYIGAKVVDDIAWNKVKEGVYKGFSIGGKALQKANGIISELRLSEISLVDRPANPECVIDTWKAEGADEADAAKGEQSEQSAEQPEGEAVEKGLYNAQRLIEALSCVKGALADADYEAKYGQHSLEVLTEMKAVMVALGAVTQKYIGEEVNPPGNAVQMGDGIDNMDIIKAGARFSKGTKDALAKMHGMIRECEKAMSELGYDKSDDEEKAEGTDDLAKADLAKAHDDLAKVSAERDDLAKRVKELEDQPAPAKAVTTAIEKSDDTKDGLHSSKPAIDPNDPLSMFKAALSQPMALPGVRISTPPSAN